MRHLWQKMQAPSDAGSIVCSVPRPLEGNPERGIVIMEPAKGTALDVLMSGVTRRSDLGPTLAGPVRNSGNWLRRMQACTSSRSDPGSVVAEVAKLAHADLQAVAAGDREIRARQAAIAASLHNLEKQLLSQPLTVTGRHGDFWPGNIFVSERRIEVIDFEGFREGLPLEDVTYFLIFLELMFPRFGGKAPGLREAFLEGYGPGSEVREAMDFFSVTAALQMLARQIALPSRSPIRIWTLRHLRKLLLRSLA
jgi:Ser/Thr protein kinase RdoA (MazF antagonist)